MLKQVMAKMVHLQKVHDQFKGLALYHKGKCEELVLTNPEQAEAQYLKCLYWVGKSENVYFKLRELAGNVTRLLQVKYSPLEKKDRGVA